jgi:hydrogenase nickel incorporation protein HypB
MVLSKVDLLPYVSFRLDDAIANARSIQPGIEILQVSTTTGAGMDDWLRWLDKR